MKKTPDKSKSRNILIGYLDRDLHKYLETVKVMKGKERLGNCHIHRRLGRLTTHCTAVPWTGSWNRKRFTGKAGEIQIKSRVQ